MTISRRTLLASLLPMAVVVGCNSTGSSPDGAAADSGDSATTALAGLTDEQAAAMANVLFDNYDAQGATFTAIAASTVTTDRIDLTGEIDWRNHVGHALVAATGPEAGVTEVFWNTEGVLERRPELITLLATLGRPPTTFAARTPDPVGRALDRLLAIVTGMASQQRDNPLLISQTAGSAFLRNDTLRGVDVQVVRYGERNLYWLAIDDGRLLRFEGNNATGNAPVVVDITAFGVQEIAGPLASDVATIEQLGDVYEAVTAGQAPAVTAAATTVAAG